MCENKDLVVTKVTGFGKIALPQKKKRICPLSIMGVVKECVRTIYGESSFLFLFSRA